MKSGKNMDGESLLGNVKGVIKKIAPNLFKEKKQYTKSELLRITRKYLGVKVSSTKFGEIIRLYNCYQMPLSIRVDLILRSKSEMILFKKFLDDNYDHII